MRYMIYQFNVEIVREYNMSYLIIKTCKVLRAGVHTLLIGISFVSSAVPTTEEAQEALISCCENKGEESVKSYQVLIDYFINHQHDTDYEYIRAAVIDRLVHFEMLRDKSLQATPVRYFVVCLLCIFFSYYSVEKAKRLNQLSLSTSTATWQIAARLLLIRADYDICGVASFIGALLSSAFLASNLEQYHNYDNRDALIIARLKNLLDISAQA
jgi:hypothetical protein